MALTVESQRKAVVVVYDNKEVKGKYATVEGEEPYGSGKFEEKLQIVNDGKFEVAYGAGFTGKSQLRVLGSKGGVDAGVIEVT